ncbi:hypothetical protein SK128_020864 [Halocaridina rubra]|uniref:Carbohydrate sulfotransferase n=1 Tax=Halocaridina rubra TaxID=373956 RepID=A0AAN9A319_HALRR
MMGWTLRGWLWYLRGALFRRITQSRSVLSIAILLVICFIIISCANVTLFGSHGELGPGIFSHIEKALPDENVEVAEDGFDYTDNEHATSSRHVIPSKTPYANKGTKKKRNGLKGKAKNKKSFNQPFYGKKDDIANRKDKLMFKRTDLKKDAKKHLLPTRNKPKLSSQSYQEDAILGDDIEWTLQMEQEKRRELRQRALRVKRECERDVRGRLSRRLGPVYDHLNWVTRYDLIWCPVFKAGSTTWMKNLLLLGGETRFNGSLHQRASKLYPVPTSPQRQKNLLEKSLKFMIVRHPFERLLSAYRDKMLRTLKSNDPYRKLQLHILENYNKEVESSEKPTHPLENNIDREDIKSEDITGNELITNLTEDGDDNASRHPSFLQFLQKVRDDMKFFWKVMDGTLVDPHWTPYWYTCASCQIQYDIIAKVETLDLDQEFIIRAANLQGVLVNARTHASKSDGYIDTDSAAAKYFGQIPIDLLRELEQLYWPDFKLYNYTADKYYDMAMSGT